MLAKLYVANTFIYFSFIFLFYFGYLYMRIYICIYMYGWSWSFTLSDAFATLVTATYFHPIRKPANKTPPDVTALSKFFFFFSFRFYFSFFLFFCTVTFLRMYSCSCVLSVHSVHRRIATPPRLHSEILGDVPPLDKLSICFSVILIWVKLCNRQ